MTGGPDRLPLETAWPGHRVAGHSVRPSQRRTRNLGHSSTGGVYRGFCHLTRGGELSFGLVDYGFAEK